MNGLHWIAPGAPPDAFPPVGQALREPAGLLAGGGDLSPERLLAAYARGIFPWYSPGQPVLWWSPDPREVLFPAEFHRSRSLARQQRRGRFSITEDRAFDAVVASCAAPRSSSPGTWITPQMRAAYARLHALGAAHSIEVWADGELAGGLYGVAVGHVFCGESMFSRRPDASKMALAHLVDSALAGRYSLIDCQMPSPHLRSLGSRSIPRARFVELLGGAGTPAA